MCSYQLNWYSDGVQKGHYSRLIELGFDCCRGFVVIRDKTQPNIKARNSCKYMLPSQPPLTANCILPVHAIAIYIFFLRKSFSPLVLFFFFSFAFSFPFCLLLLRSVHLLFLFEEGGCSTTNSKQAQKMCAFTFSSFSPPSPLSSWTPFVPAHSSIEQPSRSLTHFSLLLSLSFPFSRLPYLHGHFASSHLSALSWPRYSTAQSNAIYFFFFFSNKVNKQVPPRQCFTSKMEGSKNARR